MTLPSSADAPKAPSGAPTPVPVAAPPPGAVPAPPIRQARGWGYVWYRLKGSPLTLVGFGLTALYLAVALAAPLLAPVPDAQRGNPYDMVSFQNPEAVGPYDPGCGDPGCPFGTTLFGGDLFYGVVWGTRISIFMGLGVTLAGVAIGLVLGVLAGWYGRWLDDVVMRLTDVFLSLPLLVLALAVATAFPKPDRNEDVWYGFLLLFGDVWFSVLVIGLALVIVWWPPYTRLVRGQVLALRDSQFVEAARASGLPDWYIMARHVVPNAISPIVVQATLDIGTVVLVASALSFIGFSSGSNLPEWGRLVALGQTYMATGQWWTVLFPGLAIFGFVLAFNLMGDGLRDILDPRGRR